MEDDSIYVLSGAAVKLLIWLCKKETGSIPDQVEELVKIQKENSAIKIDEVYFSNVTEDATENPRDPSVEIKAYQESMPDVSSTDDNARVILVPNEKEATYLFGDQLKLWGERTKDSQDDDYFNVPYGKESWIGAYLLVDVTEGDPEGDDWKLTPTLVKHWKDETTFKPGDDWNHQYYNARFYKTDGGELWLGGMAGLFILGNTTGSDPRIAELEEKIATLQTEVNGIPKLTATQKKDGKAYALVNGVYDDICGADYTLLAEKDATAQSLALKSLESGVLVIDGADEQMIEEMREILGEERFNEMAAASVQTMELKPQMSIEEQIEAAKAAYDRRKAEALAEAEIVESSDVEPINKEKK